MKLLTLNTHSLQEDHYEKKLEQFVDTILQVRPDIIAMQEVNQSMEAPVADNELLKGFYPCPGESVPLRVDNHAAQAAKRLRARGLDYCWTWISAKIGYGKYDEGMALFGLQTNIAAAESFLISGCQDYAYWKTRKVLGMRTDDSDDWFYTVHMGWWQDEEEPFAAQWERFHTHLQKKKKDTSAIWLMGDFNSPSQFRGQGYDRIRTDGWHDTYELAEKRDGGITVRGCIDGWRSFSESDTMPEGMRMDHIWCSRCVPVQSSAVIFNGENGPEVSDHFGVLITTGGPSVSNK
ncbi:Maltose 6'-phosphate phosphatase [Eubacterium plexicaudatum ASF492]|uniref:Endonuclease/exonuclease/phosphatase domain-containing protein n=1 Tax=Eubacterium plexicaudatum ASF492 TaxID=1235802 RepID=N2BF70_9FIRM|nr:Maltose 6'-phosphate phosphatase [Eubacterium plexicaudatum ASF492]